MSSYDLVVIGSGPAGYVAAIKASQMGLKTACIEKETPLGGTCLNIGCIPSKALLDSSEHFYQANHHFKNHGIIVDKIRMDIAQMMKRKEDVVSKLTGGISFLFKKYKVERFTGFGKIKSPTTVEVQGKDAQLLTTKKILIATGSEPTPLPNIAFDGKKIFTSTEALSLAEVPKKMIVVGAGAVGLELGSVWSRLGSEVTIVEFKDRLLPWVDEDVARALQKAMESQGIKFLLGTASEKSDIKKDEVVLTLKKDGKSFEEKANCVLVAVGRRPFTKDLGAKEVGVEVDERGFIKVNANYQTKVPSIFAIGDTIPGPMLAHKASEEALSCVEKMCGKPGIMNYKAIPNVVYTYPEVASVGMTSEQCKAQGIEIKEGKFPFSVLGRSLAMEAPEGFVKITSHAKSDKVLGIQIISARASDMIAEGTLAIEFSSSTEDIARTIHAHPTMPEALKEAAHILLGHAVHV